MLTNFNGTRVESSGSDLDDDDSPGPSGLIATHYHDDGMHCEQLDKNTHMWDPVTDRFILVKAPQSSHAGSSTQVRGTQALSTSGVVSEEEIGDVVAVARQPISTAARSPLHPIRLAHHRLNRLHPYAHQGTRPTTPLEHYPHPQQTHGTAAAGQPFARHEYQMSPTTTAMEQQQSHMQETHGTGAIHAGDVAAQQPSSFKRLHQSGHLTTGANLIPTNVVTNLPQWWLMAPPTPPRANPISNVAQQSDPAMHELLGPPQTLTRAIERSQFWHLIIDMVKRDDLDFIVRRLDRNDIYKFRVRSPELLAVVWTLTFGTFKTFSDVIKELTKLQRRGILEVTNNPDRQLYTFNIGNMEVTTYAENDSPTTSLDEEILEQIHELDVPLINNHYRMSKSDESLTFWKLAIYLMRKSSAFQLIIQAQNRDHDRWWYSIKDAGRLAIAWSLLLHSRRTPAYLAGLLLGAKSKRNKGATIPTLKLNLTNHKLLTFTTTPFSGFGYSRTFRQQLRLLCRTQSAGLSTAMFKNSVALTEVLTEDNSGRE